MPANPADVNPGTIQVISAAIVTVITIVGGFFSLRLSKKYELIKREEERSDERHQSVDRAEIEARQGLFREQRDLIAIMRDERRDMLRRVEELTKLVERRENERIDLRVKVIEMEKELTILTNQAEITQSALARCKIETAELTRKCERLEITLLNKGGS